MAHTTRRWQRFAIVGDIHLRTTTQGYGFDGDIPGLIQWVRSLRRAVDAVICVGDLYDLDRSKLPLDFGTEHRRVRQTWGEPLEELESLFDIFLVGNHDSWLASANNWYESVDVTTPGGSWRVEHGHRFDSWLKRRRGFTQLVTWASGQADELGAKRLHGAMRGVERMMGRGVLSGGGNNISRAHSWLETRPDLCGLAFGHTHDPLAAQAPNGAFMLNAGSCMRAPWRAAIVDGVELEAVLLEGSDIDAETLVVSRSQWRGAK